MSRRLVVFLVASIAGLFCCDTVFGEVPNVEVVVNGSLYAGGEIQTGLNQYLLNIRKQGYNPILTTTSFPDASALRSHLTSRYENDGLAGAVFIGDLPAAQFEIPAHGTWSRADFPCDLFFQDLDGTWSDADGNGKYDGHSGSVAPEIWFGRLLTHTLTTLHPGRTEAGMLNDYFIKNNAYRTGQLAVSNNGLAYIDDDWAHSICTCEFNSAVGGSVIVVTDGATTTSDDYESRLLTEYEHVLLCAHSTSSYHRFKIGYEETGGKTYNYELEAINPKVLFYNLYACSNARFTSDGYMAGEYVFGNDFGLVAVGSTKVGGMQNFRNYFHPLGEGDTFGQALENWWLETANYGFDGSEQDWYYGMTIIGDPLLVTQEYIPEPASLSLLAVGGMVLLIRRRCK